VPANLPNVLATRYASDAMVQTWSPANKVILERELWIAVLEAQRDLGVDVPDGVIEAYQAVIRQVDLESIDGRERVTKHDVKARIEEMLDEGLRNRQGIFGLAASPGPRALPGKILARLIGNGT